MYSKVLSVILSGMIVVVLSACGSRETTPAYNTSPYSRYSPTVGSSYGNGYYDEDELSQVSGDNGLPKPITLVARKTARLSLQLVKTGGAH